MSDSIVTSRLTQFCIYVVRNNYICAEMYLPIVERVQTHVHKRALNLHEKWQFRLLKRCVNVYCTEMYFK